MCHVSGASTTPSRDMKKLETILPIGTSLLGLSPPVLPLMTRGVQPVQVLYSVQVAEPHADASPAVPPPPWARAPQRSQGRRREPLTQERIVEAALGVLD